MNKTIKRLFLTLLVIFFYHNSAAQTTVNLPKECDEKNVTLKTELKSRYRYFFFRRTNFVKTKRFDRIIDAEGNIVREIMMRSETRGDQSVFRKFHRLVIVGKEIHEVICKLGKSEGKVIVYNFCGEKLRVIKMVSDELYDKYRF